MSQVTRRQLLIAACAFCAPISRVFAQAQKTSQRIGFLGLSGKAYYASRLSAFKESLRDYGYIEGRDYVLELRFADNQPDRLQGLASELVRARPDLIMGNPTGPTRALQSATTSIPIVAISSGDPVGQGLAKSLAQPGGNVTGTSNSLTDIASKPLELLRNAVPGLSRVAVLFYPRYPSHLSVLRILQSQVPPIGIVLLPIEINAIQEIEPAFVRMARQNADGVIVVTDSTFADLRQQLAELAIRHKLPCAGYLPDYADGGFLIGYGPNTLEIYRRTAYFVDRILKGSKPANIPFEQPAKFELVVNLKTAKALRLTIPQSLLLRADRVIE